MKTATTILVLTFVFGLVASSITHGQQGDGDQSIILLKVERERLVNEYGPSHPTVKVYDARIDAVAKKSRVPKKAGKKKSTDDELRLTVQLLMQRVEVLEREVAVLKNPPARTQLLGK